MKLTLKILLWPSLKRHYLMVDLAAWQVHQGQQCNVFIVKVKIFVHNLIGRTFGDGAIDKDGDGNDGVNERQRHDAKLHLMKTAEQSQLAVTHQEGMHRHYIHS